VSSGQNWEGGRGCWGRERHETEHPVRRNHLPFLLVSLFLPAPALPAHPAPLSAPGPGGSVLGCLRSSLLSYPGATPATTKGLRWPLHGGSDSIQLMSSYWRRDVPSIENLGFLVVFFFLFCLHFFCKKEKKGLKKK